MSKDLTPEFLKLMFGEVARGAPIVISAFDREGRFLLQIGKGLAKLGLEPNQLRGASVFEAFAGADEALEKIRAALAGEAGENTQNLGDTTWDNWFSPLRDGDGEIMGAISVSTDVTEREPAQAALEERLHQIKAQAQAISELAAPIIQVWSDVFVVPLSGEVSEARASSITERLLQTLSTQGARHVILDLTGVDVIDSRTCELLIRVLQAAALLGVRGGISGLSPAVAQTLVSLGIDLGAVASTYRTLHDGLRACMAGSDQG